MSSINELAYIVLGVAIGIATGAAAMFYYNRRKLDKELSGFKELLGLMYEIKTQFEKHTKSLEGKPNSSYSYSHILNLIEKITDKTMQIESSLRPNLGQKERKEIKTARNYFELKAGFLHNGYFDLGSPRTLFILKVTSNQPGTQGAITLVPDIDSHNWLIKNHLNGALQNYCELSGNLSTLAKQMIVLEEGKVVCDAPNRWRLLQKMVVKLV